MKRILIVDGADRFRRICRALFPSEGYLVLEAASIDQADEIINHQPVDLVLWDASLRPSDEKRFLNIMRLLRLRTKVIVTSTSRTGQPHDIVPGTINYFDKSRGIGELLAKIKGVFEPASALMNNFS